MEIQADIATAYSLLAEEKPSGITVAQKGSATKAISGNVNIVIDVAQIIREVAVLWILVRITPALKRGVKISINNKPLPPDEAGAKK